MIADVGELLYHEAHLLDSGRFHDWLELLAPGLRYWAPVRADLPRDDEAGGEAGRLLLFDETRESLALRVRRLDTGLAWSEIPATRTRRLIGNIVHRDEGDGRVGVRSNFIVFRSRSPGDETILAGAREDLWSRAGRWLLCERRIIVDHRSVENMSLFL
jgi:3-phenylpropionate/cinnamic acid dioxygenase small subunit